MSDFKDKTKQYMRVPIFKKQEKENAGQQSKNY